MAAKWNAPSEKGKSPESLIHHCGVNAEGTCHFCVPGWPKQLAALTPVATRLYRWQQGNLSEQKVTKLPKLPDPCCETASPIWGKCLAVLPLKLAISLSYTHRPYIFNNPSAEKQILFQNTQTKTVCSVRMPNNVNQTSLQHQRNPRMLEEMSTVLT